MTPAITNTPLHINLFRVSMKNPDMKYFIGSEKRSYQCYILSENRYQLVTRRKNDLITKVAEIEEAQFYCKRHKIDFPTNNQ